MTSVRKITRDLYENGYKKNNPNIIKKYPNEELCRFFGRNYFQVKNHLRKKIRILETGCGVSNNLWMIADEGFSAYGIDISKSAIRISKKIFKKKKLKADFFIGDFTKTKFKENYFNCVTDVFSSSCLNKSQGEKYIKEVNRILKKEGKFFSFFPSKKSTMFRSKKKKVYDRDTINCYGKSPFSNQPMRFQQMFEYCNLLKKNNFNIDYKEENMRTYYSGKDKFYFLIIEASKTL
jgi:ubiquinone/menaquinone biosynthesis C-methylase UbiE